MEKMHRICTRIVSIGFLILVPRFSHAQFDHSFGGATTTTRNPAIDPNALSANDKMGAIERLYNQRLDENFTKSQQAQLRRADCANQEARERNNIAAQDARDKGQFGGQALGAFGQPLGALAAGALQGAGDEKKIAKDYLDKGYRDDASDVQTRARTALGANCGDVGQISVNKSTGRASGGSVNCSPDPQCETKCLRAQTIVSEGRSNITSSYQQSMRDFAGSSHLTSQAVTGAIAATLSTVGAGLALNASQKGNKFGRENAALTRAACEQGAQIEIDSLARERQRIEADKANAIMQAALAAAAEQNIGEDVQKLAPGEPTKLAPIPIAGAPLPSATKKGNFALTPGGGNGAGGGPTGGGGGGGGGGQSPGWNFGGGGGDSAMGGGLPTQGQATASAFEGSGGGDFGGFGGGEPPLEEGLMGEEGVEGEFAVAPAVGDGGLNVLLSRARIIYAKNASTLVRSLSARPLARSQNPGPTPASVESPSIKGKL